MVKNKWSIVHRLEGITYKNGRRVEFTEADTRGSLELNADFLFWVLYLLPNPIFKKSAMKQVSTAVLILTRL